MSDEERSTPDSTPPSGNHEIAAHTPPAVEDRYAVEARVPRELRESPWHLRPHLPWLLGLALVLLALRFIVPYLAEQIAYSINRGAQRAAWENAGENLQNVSLRELSHDSELIWQRIGPSVVHISVRGSAGDGVSRAAPLDQSRQPERFFALGQGSGIVMTADGYILTNHHVVDGAEDIDVHLPDGRHEPAHVVGSDELTDLALIKISAANLIPAEWGDSEHLDVGAAVWAVGSPFGLERSLSFGILSGKDRSGFAGTPHQDFLQTDVAVNPGNSGGPLVNVEGQVVGINTAIIGQSYQGISFAIPSNVAREVYEKLKANGQVVRGWLGVALDDVSPERAREAGLAHAQGAYIMQVVEDPARPSPAKLAGLEAGDIVLRWQDLEVRTSSELSRLVAGTPIGAEANLVLWRDGKELTFKIKVTERPAKVR